jgi:myo-inositol-1(or 4)-monophosphatase
MAAHKRTMQMHKQDMLQAVQSAFRQVRPAILEKAGKDAASLKDDGSPFTDTEVTVENTVLAELERRLPGIPVFGEESGYDEDRLPASFWLIDPVDGTKSFLQNVPAYTCMAVFIHNNEAAASVIYNPSYDDMYVALKGGGAYKNGVRLDLTSMPLPQVAYCRERLVVPVGEMLKPAGVACEPGPTGAGYGFSLVASGELAARINMPHRPGGGHIHDYAPGALLVREANGVIVPLEGSEYTYKMRSFAACHPRLAPVLRQHARQLRELEVQTAK